MNDPRFAPSVVYPAAARRAGMAALLLAAFAAYAARGPAAPRAVIAAMTGRSAPAAGGVTVYSAGPDAPQDNAPARDAKAMGDLLGRLGIPPLKDAGSIITDKEPAPLDEAARLALYQEASAGIAGPAVASLLADAEKRGVMDLPLYGGRSMRQIHEHVATLSAKADALAEESRKRGYEALGVKADEARPEIVVPRMIERLNEAGVEEKSQASMVLCESRFARWPGAAAALPLLDAYARAGDAGSEFAQMAAGRIRYFAARSELDAKIRPGAYKTAP